MKRLVGLVLALAVMTLVAGDAMAAAHRFGVGANYWRTIDEIKDDSDIESNGLSWYLTYQMILVPLFRLEADLEWYPNGYGGSTEGSISPEAFALVGAGLYGGLGVGINYADSAWADDPFYMLRAGYEMQLSSGMILDLNLNYRFIDWDVTSELDQHVNTDTILIGAALRMQF